MTKKSFYKFVLQLCSNKFIKYTVGCSFSIVIKIALTNLFVFSLSLPAQYAYIFVHVILLFFSFTFHTKITFNNKISFSLFRDYSVSVFAFKLLDYALFLIGIKVLRGVLKPYILDDYLGYIISASILLSTVFIFLLRFIVYNKVLVKK